MKFIKLFIFDDEYSDQHQDGYHSINDPSHEEVEDAIRNINGKNRRSVKLIDEDYGFLSIGCGFYCRVNTVNPPSMSRLMNPNHIKDHPDPRQLQDPDCVPRELVLEAALHYFRTGELKESLLWDQVE